jgi:hypothetical protein
MGKIPVQGNLFPPEPGGSDVVNLNGRCQIRREGSALVVLVSGLPVAHFSDEDRPAAANAMVMLVEHGWAQQVEVARAFDCDVRTVTGSAALRRSRPRGPWPCGRVPEG